MCYGKKAGSTTIKIADNTTGMDYRMSFTVIASVSFKIDRGSGLTNQTQPLIVDFEGKWKITSSYGWSVYSPNVGIIEVTDSGHKDGILKFKAKRSDIAYIPGNPGLTYIQVTEKETGAWQKHWIQVKPYVTKLQLANHYQYHNVGDYTQLIAKTSPQNFANLKGHGNITWKTTNPKIATVDNGIVSFKSPGDVVITATYSDGKHDSVSLTTSAYFTVKPRVSNLRINRGVVDDKVVCEDDKDPLKCWENVITGQKREWYITSTYGWRVYSPNVYNSGRPIITVTRKGNTLNYTAVAPGSTYIDIIENVTNFKRRFEINVKQYTSSTPQKTTTSSTNNTKSTIKIERNIDNNIIKEKEEYIIEGYLRTWKISNSNGGWYPLYKEDELTVHYNEKSGTLTYSGKKVSRKPVELSIVEKATKKIYTYNIYVEPKVTKIAMRYSVGSQVLSSNNLDIIHPKTTANGKKVANGKTVSFTAITYPSNYVGKKGYGIVTWSVTPSDKAEINPNTGKLTIKADGRIKVTVSYKETKDSIETKFSKTFDIMGFFPERYVNALDFKVTSADNKVTIKEIQPMYVGSTTKWVIHSNYGFADRYNDPEKILNVSIDRNHSSLTITAQKTGTAYINILELMTGKSIPVKIAVSPKPNLQITRPINNKNIFENEENVFVGSLMSWTVSSTHNWNYSVSKSGIINVSKTHNGIRYTALSPGTTQIKITETLTDSAYNSKTITIKVLKQPTKFTISTSTTSLGTGEALQFNYQTNDGVEKYISNKYVTWFSTNENVAKINKNGLLTASSDGSTEVYAYYDNTRQVGGGTARIYSKRIKINVYVSYTPHRELLITPKQESMTVGQSQKINAVINDISKKGKISKTTRISGKNLSWTSDNPTVAKIDENGNLTALCSGSTIIKASYNGLNSNTYKIEVKVKQK